jgi:hypothetical protein
MSGVAKDEEKSDEYSQDMTQAMGAGKLFSSYLYMSLDWKL